MVLPPVWAHTRSSLRNSLSPQCGWVHTRPRTRPQLSVLVRHTAAPVIPSARNAAGFIRGPVPVLSSAYWLGIQLPHGYAGFAPFSHLPSRLSSSLRILPSPSPIDRRLARRLSRAAGRSPCAGGLVTDVESRIALALSLCPRRVPTLTGPPVTPQLLGPVR